MKLYFGGMHVIGDGEDMIISKRAQLKILRKNGTDDKFPIAPKVFEGNKQMLLEQAIREVREILK